MSREMHFPSVEVWLPGVDVTFDCTDVYYNPGSKARGFNPGEPSEVRLEGPIKIGTDDFDEFLSEKARGMIHAALKEKLDIAWPGETRNTAYQAPTDREL